MGLGFATLLAVLGALLALVPLGLPDAYVGIGWMLAAGGLFGMVAAVALHLHRHSLDRPRVAPPRRTSS